MSSSRNRGAPSKSSSTIRARRRRARRRGEALSTPAGTRGRSALFHATGPLAPCAARSVHPYAVRMTYDPRQPDPRNTPDRPSLTPPTFASPLAQPRVAQGAPIAPAPTSPAAVPVSPKAGRTAPVWIVGVIVLILVGTRRLLPQRDRTGRVDHRDAARVRAAGGRPVRGPDHRPLGARAARAPRARRRVGRGRRRRHHPRRRPAASRSSSVWTTRRCATRSPPSSRRRSSRSSRRASACS